MGLSYEGSQVPTLCLQGLEVNSSEGCVEFQNCALSGLGTPEALPTGIGDCVLRVAAGACSLISCQLRMTKGHAGFGIVVGPHPSLDLKAQLRLRGTEVMHAARPSDLYRAFHSQASTACVCFMGGLVTIEEGCSFRDCRVGISACDEGSCAMIVSKLQVLCREGGQRFEEAGHRTQGSYCWQVSGGLVVQRRESL